jgi:hypothetical protein
MFLRNTLLIDAATCVATGALLSVGAQPLSALLGLPASLLFYAGVGLFPIAAFMVWAALRRQAPAIWIVILGNAAWVLASIVVLFGFSPTVLGYVFVTVQAIAVAFLAELEYAGLRKVAA